MQRRAPIAVLAIAAGCAPSLSSFQPAHVAPRGHFLAEMGMDVSIPTGTIDRTKDAAKTLVQAAQSRELSPQEREQLFDAGVNLALNPPGVGYHLGLAYTVIERLELSLRYAVQAWRLGVRVQILEQAARGVDLSVGIGAARYTFSFPIGKVVDVLELKDFERWQIDVPMIVGRSADWYRLWGGPKLLFTRYDTGVELALPNRSVELAGAHGNGVYAGAHGGVALGYRFVFVAFELTLAQLVSTAHLRGETLGTRDVDISSFVFYPSVGLIMQL